MNITVLGDTYAVSDAVGRKFYLLMAKGMDELDAAAVAVAHPADPEPDPLVSLTSKFLEAIKSMNQPSNPVFNLTMPQYPNLEPSFNVAAAEVNVPATVVNLPPMDPTIVVDLSDVEPANVTVNVPEQAPPTVHVNVPKAELKATVKAEMPSEMRITSMPDRVTRRKISRDPKGLIDETTDVETDA